MKNLKAWQFYLLSFTWGLPMSLLGCLVCGVLMCFGKRPKRYGHAFYIPIGGGGWGGLELGWFFLVDKYESEFIKNHELGHAYQSACILGWAYPIFWLIAIVRYWVHRFGVHLEYHKWWLERQANDIGSELMKGKE